MRGVVVIALTAERIPAAFHAAVIADRSSAIGALRDSGLPARHTYVAITWYVFDLTEWIHGTPIEYQRATMRSSQPTFW